MEIIWILVFVPMIAFSADLTAKGLAIADAYLGYFVTVTPSSQMNICGTAWTIYNAELTACGTSYIRDSVIETLMQLSYLAEDFGGMTNILLGLFAV